MDIRLSLVAGPAALGPVAALATNAGPSTGPALDRVGPATSVDTALGHGNAILAGLSSPLESAGLLSSAASGEAALANPIQPVSADASVRVWLLAGTLQTEGRISANTAIDTPASPQPDASRGAQPATPAAAGEAAAAAQPLTPAWVTSLQTPAMRHGPWLPARARPRRQPGQGGHGSAHEDDVPPATGLAPAEVGEITMPIGRDGPAPPWPAGLTALLPDEALAELARRRSMLLVAPPGPGQRGLQLAGLGFDRRGQPICHRWAVRGAPAATDTGRDWLFWRVRREGDDGQRPVLSARPTTPRQTAASGLVLRATATVLPAPLRPASHAWIDVLEPQRLWHDLGAQWTLLLAWSPRPLPLGRPCG